MIYETLQFIATQLNTEVTFTDPSPPEYVMLGNAAKTEDPTIGEDLKSKVLVSMVNIEEERMMRTPDNFIKTSDNKAKYKEPPMYFNLYVLFTSNFENYGKALSNLQKVLLYFQGKHVFESTDFADLADAGIEKLIFDLHNLNLEQVHQLWTTMGGKYMPSALFKVRMVVLDNDVQTDAPVITSVTVNKVTPEDFETEMESRREAAGEASKEFILSNQFK